MADAALANTGAAPTRPSGWRGIAADWSSDQRAFKNVSWGKAMMWIFLLSDTFIFSCFLLSSRAAIPLGSKRGRAFHNPDQVPSRRQGPASLASSNRTHNGDFRNF